jgi:hypothetical protein
MKQGKYYKANKYLDKYQSVVRDEDRLSELKERLGRVSQPQMAESKAQQGTMARVLKVLAYIWFGLFGTLLVISGIAYILIEGFWTFAQLWSPVSILSLLFVFSPGIAALLLAKWLEKR